MLDKFDMGTFAPVLFSSEDPFLLVIAYKSFPILSKVEKLTLKIVCL